MSLQRCPGCGWRLRDTLPWWAWYIAPSRICLTREHAPEPAPEELLDELQAYLLPPSPCELCGLVHDGDCLNHQLRQLQD